MLDPSLEKNSLGVWFEKLFFLEKYKNLFIYLKKKLVSLFFENKLIEKSENYF